MKLITQTSRFAILLLLLLCSSAAALAQADLSLRLSQSTAQPARYSIYSVTATITNSGPMAASNVAVSVPIPAGLVFTGGNEFTASQGTFSPYFGTTWEVGTLAPNQSATLTVNLFLLAPTAPAYYAQVIRSSATDPDSTPGNGTPPTVNEDDEASTAVSAASRCDLELVMSSISCVNDNRTPSDPSDDYFVAEVKATSPLRGDGQPITISLAGISLNLTSLTGTFTEIALPARFMTGGTFAVIAAFDTEVDCNVTVTGTVPTSCPSSVAACGFDKTFPGVVFSSTKLASQVGNDYVIESNGQKLTISSNGSSAMVGNTALLTSNVTFNAQPLANGTRYSVQFVGGATPVIVIRLLDANGNTISTVNVPVATALAGLGNVAISDFTNYAGQYVMTGTATLPGTSSPRIFVARGSLVKGAFAFSQLDALVPGVPKTYSSIKVAAISQAGDVYLEGMTSTGYDLARVSSSGRLVWGRTVVAGTNLGSVAYDTEISTDGTKLYVASKEAGQLIVNTLTAANGNNMGLPFNVSLATVDATTQPGSGMIGGLLPLANGNVLVSYSKMRLMGTMQNELLWIAPNGTTANRIIFPGDAVAGALNPVLETKSAELVFTTTSAAGLRVLQLRSDGSATPDCGAVPSRIDLELSVVSASPSPRRYTVNPVTYTIVNKGPLAATAVTVSIPNVPGSVLAGGSEFSASQGTYSSYGNQVWTVGSLAAGASATITINYFGLAANGYTSYGQVATAAEPDSDSTPGNGLNGMVREDDEAVVTVGASLRDNKGSTEYLRVYPNPAITGQSVTFALDIPVQTQQSAEVIVSDLAGRVVLRQKVELTGSETQLTLNLAGVPSGVYVAAVPDLALEPQRLIVSE